MATRSKQLVEAALYGSGDRRRFTLDSPVLSDVWTLFFEKPSARLSLLLEPWLDTPAFTVGDRLRARIAEHHSVARVTYNRTIVVADLDLPDVIRDVLPLTGWYLEIARAADPDYAGSDIRLPTLDEVWDDLSLPDDLDPGRRAASEGGERRRRYPFPRLLGFIRIAGLVLLKRNHEVEGGNRIIDGPLRSLATQPAARRARRRVAELALQGWKSAELRLPPAGEKIVYAINRNRPARLSIAQSVRTVKADAAATVFGIDCSTLTWAIVDSGVDASHDAFIDRAFSGERRSRIVATYDFSDLREILTAETPEELPRRVRAQMRAERIVGGVGQERLATMHDELIDRVRRSRQVDWELLRPFVQVTSDEERRSPPDPHGTHVAGILAADWDRGRERMRGMCPNINLVDIRVCRKDGTSDEFVIMSALQFVRYLNANSDRMAVHGVNMSLSLEHDAAVYACGRTPVCEEAERTIASGVVVVAAAGNHGYRRIMAEGSQPFEQFCPVSITDPGNADGVITVGSTHRLEPHTYGVSYFSSRGPTGDGRVKPDLVAPGEKIFAPAPGNEAMRLDGTSMAAPHVSGAAAMLMARHVELVGRPQRIKHILCSTATDLGREPYFQGKGLVDVLRAIQSV